MKSHAQRLVLGCSLVFAIAGTSYAQNTETAKIVAQHTVEITALRNDVNFLKNEVLNLRNQNMALRSELLQANRDLETRLMAQIPLARAPGEAALNLINTDLRPKLQTATTSIQTLTTGALALKGQLQAVDTRTNFIVRQADGNVNFVVPNGRFQFMINGNFCYQASSPSTTAPSPLPHCWN